MSCSVYYNYKNPNKNAVRVEKIYIHIVYELNTTLPSIMGLNPIHWTT